MNLLVELGADCVDGGHERSGVATGSRPYPSVTGPLSVMIAPYYIGRSTLRVAGIERKLVANLELPMLPIGKVDKKSLAALHESI